MILFILSLVVVTHSISIDTFGAIPNNDSIAICKLNSLAIQKALQYANNSQHDKEVLVPNQHYYILDIQASNLVGVTIKVEGILYASKNMTAWNEIPFTHTRAVLYISDSHYITITGPGSMDGQGYDWWWHVIIDHDDTRPHLLTMERCTNVLIHNMLFKDSPQFHLLLSDMKDVVVRDVVVFVNVEGQKSLLEKASYWSKRIPIPTFPLNTDGIDPSGTNFLIENVTITNFDDAVAVKPMNKGGKYSQCTSNVTVRNARVYFGVGMTIGSVPPNKNVNCIRNVTFEDVTFSEPIKAIYIKTNPGQEGTGIIDDITYRNIKAVGSLWYPIWIGPQQQKQPGTNGTGCSWLYPIEKECPTQPRVPITNVRLHNITLEGGDDLPGVLLCNATAPCTGFEFINVRNTGEFLVQKNYACENVKARFVDSTPVPSCV